MMNAKLSRRKFLTVSAMAAATFSMNWAKIASCEAALGPRENYPTVIIGAGLGGLCCGAYLARQGFPVTVVEQHSVPGGYATSFDRASGKFTFEVSLHGTGLGGEIPKQILDDIGILEKIDLVELPEIYSLITPDITISVPQKNPDEYVRRLTRHFPEEAEGIRGFVEEMVLLHDEVTQYEQKSDFNKTAFKPFFPLLYRRMWRVRNKTLADLLDDHLRNPAAKGLLAGLWGYYGLPPSKLSGFYYANATGGYLRHGSYYIRQRSQNMSLAIADAIEDAGGSLIYDTAVEGIHTANGAVSGVALADGTNLSARSVVSNASALNTLQDLLPKNAVPAKYLETIQRYRPSISTFIVWLGLNKDIREKVDAYSTHVVSGKGPEADYRAAVNGNVDEVSFSVTVYDKLFSGYSASGTSTMMLLCLSGYGPWEKYEASYKAGRKSAYSREKQSWSKILIRRAEEALIPGLAEMVEVIETASPLTNWRYTGNTQGAIYGFEQSMDNAYMNRIENRTPVKGLYLAGAWGNPGGGFEGAMRSGAKAFSYLLQDWGKERR